MRDWSFAGDVMDGAWLMLQQDEPDDYILASGIGHTVAEFAEAAFARVGLRAEDHIRVEEVLRRAPELTASIGDPTHARTQPGWQPTLSFTELIHRMVDADLRRLRDVDL